MSLKGSFSKEANSVRKGWLYGSRYKEETKKGKRIFIWASSIVLLLVISAIFEHIYAEIYAKDRWNDKARGFTTRCYGEA